MKKKQENTRVSSKIAQLDIIDLNFDDFPEETAEEPAYTDYDDTSYDDGAYEDTGYDEATYENTSYEDATYENTSYEEAVAYTQEEYYEEPVYEDDAVYEDELDYLPEEEYEEPAPVKKVKKKGFNLHLLFPIALVLIVVAVVIRLANWGVKIDLDDFFKDKEVLYQDDTFDQILPLTAEDGTVIRGKEKPTIVFMGNAPFADDRYDDNNLVNLIAKKTDATVYNCSISGSYLAALYHAYDPNIAPMDAFNFYWMAQYICSDEVDFYYPMAKEIFGDRLPEAADEVINTLNTLDFNQVDVLAIMYDASDYFNGNGMYNDENPTDIMQFTGNLEAGIELIQSVYPNIRIIVMSPTYAYGVNEAGEYVSSDAITYGQDVLSTYVIRQCVSTTSHGVTFVDNLYGTITEENADKYLSDYIHLNQKGREYVANRFIYALEYYNEQ